MTMAPAGPPRPVGDTLAALAALPTMFACDGCGFRAEPTEPVPQRCPRAVAGDDTDHVLRRMLASGRVAFPALQPATEPAAGPAAIRPVGGSPFETYRTLFHAYHAALGCGWTDTEYVTLVRGLDEAVAAVDGQGFRPTPLIRADALGEAIGLDGVLLVKDETGNVAGSHKARHLMATALELEVAARFPGASSTVSAPLAIASCGNAALAAAVVAAAWGRELRVFVPTDANPAILERLRDLRATVVIVPRDPAIPGDPTVHALRAAIGAGAIPFTCQGPENAFAIEGGHTLGYELATQLAADGRTLDRLFIQVGGGALAASVATGLEEARALGALERLPRIHAVQSRNVQPLMRAYRHVVDFLAPRLGAGEELPEPGAQPAAWQARADRLRDALAAPAAAALLAEVPRRRSAYMWPWGEEPHSVAGGIVDDETYDWFAVVRHMLRTGGWPVVADEPTLERAAAIGPSLTGIPADATGTAGLAGLLTLHGAGGIGPAETVGLLFTGVRRTPVHGEPR